jgi:hypothetical protein
MTSRKSKICQSEQLKSLDDFKEIKHLPIRAKIIGNLNGSSGNFADRSQYGTQ